MQPFYTEAVSEAGIILGASTNDPRITVTTKMVPASGQHHAALYRKAMKQIRYFSFPKVIFGKNKE